MNDDLLHTHNHRPANFMTSWEDRISSFHTWPLDIKPLPVAMAAAGFYHSNIHTDTVTCFSCNRSFPDWKKHDDPIQRHLRQSSVFPRCAWMDEVTKQPTQNTPLTPPTTPPVPIPAGIPHKCKACQGIFPSLSSFHRHRLQAHRGKRGRLGIPLKQPEETLKRPRKSLKRPGEGFMGPYRVSKATKQRMKHGRRGNTDLWDSE